MQPFPRPTAQHRIIVPTSKQSKVKVETGPRWQCSVGASQNLFGCTNMLAGPVRGTRQHQHILARLYDCLEKAGEKKSLSPLFVQANATVTQL